MATIQELKGHGLPLFISGKFLPALQIYDAIVRQHPLDLGARIKVADCLAALGQQEKAQEVYRAAGWYAIKSGHPLTGLVCVKLLEEMAANADDLISGLIMHYGCESTHIGNYAARINSPAKTTQVSPPNLQAEIPPGFVEAAAQRATIATQDFDEYPEDLHPIPMLSALHQETLRQVLSTIVVHRMADGQNVINEGESGESFFFVASGHVRIVRNAGKDNELHIANLSENSVFGEMALLSNQPRSASVVVSGEADLIEMTRESLRCLGDQLQSVAQSLHDFTHSRLLENLLAQSPLFAPFTPVEQHDLLRRFTEHDVGTGTEILHEGDQARGIFIVLSGEIAIIKGRDLVLATLKSGEIFGEISVIRNSPTTASARALIPSTVLFLSLDYVQRIVAGVPKVGEFLTKLASERELDTKLTLG